MQDRYIAGIIVIICMTTIQAIAWYFNIDGAVFNFTSLIIGAVVGALFGVGIATSKKE